MWTIRETEPKQLFYYTAEGRVDFRELIKKMAEAFRVRIEMRQIGMRQEASRLGGIGSCGRELCCSTWLTDFKTVSTSAARYQNLSLNTLKLAGQCGKLKCCLNYELDTYMDAIKDIPNNVERLETTNGTAKLQKTDIFKKLMWFSFPNQENWIPVPVSRVKEIYQMNRERNLPEYLLEEVAKIDVEKVLDYENVVGQDSLTRLDERNRKKKNHNNRNRNKQKNASSMAATPVPGHQKDVTPGAGTRPLNERTAGNERSRSNRNKRRRPNQNQNREKPGE